MKKVSLYHGSDARILSMTLEERKDFKRNCEIAVDFLWKIFGPFWKEHIQVPVNKPGYEGCTMLENRLIELKDPLHYAEDATKYLNLLDALCRIESNNMGNPSFQYKHFYLTNSIRRAIGYAQRAFSFGEIGLNAYRLLDAAETIGFSACWQTDPKTAKALAKIKKFAEAESIPVVLEFTDYNTEQLREENGREIMMELDLCERSFCYLGELDVATAIYRTESEAINAFEEKANDLK